MLRLVSVWKQSYGSIHIAMHRRVMDDDSWVRFMLKCTTSSSQLADSIENFIFKIKFFGMPFMVRVERISLKNVFYYNFTILNSWASTQRYRRDQLVAPNHMQCSQTCPWWWCRPELLLPRTQPHRCCHVLITKLSKNIKFMSDFLRCGHMQWSTVFIALNVEIDVFKEGLFDSIDIVALSSD